MSCRHLFACLVLWTGLAAQAAEPPISVPSPHAIDIPKWFSESFLELRDDIQDAARSGKRLMIYVGQDGCPYCQTLMQVNFSQRDIVDATRKHFVAVALNLWGDREVTWLDGRKLSEKALAAELKVQFTPTLLFFDEQGKVVLRLNGYSPPDKFRAALAYASAGGERKQSFSEFLQKQPAAATAPTPRLAFASHAPIDFSKLFAASDKPVVVIVEHGACHDCAELHRDGLKRPEVARLLKAFRVVQIGFVGTGNVIGQDGKILTESTWSREQNVTYVPTLMFFDTSGEEVFRNEGYLRPFHLATTLDYVASGAYLKEPSFQRHIKQRAEALRAKGEKVELWE